MREFFRDATCFTINTIHSGNAATHKAGSFNDTISTRPTKGMTKLPSTSFVRGIITKFSSSTLGTPIIPPVLHVCFLPLHTAHRQNDHVLIKQIGLLTFKIDRTTGVNSGICHGTEAYVRIGKTGIKCDSFGVRQEAYTPKYTGEYILIFAA